MCSSTAAGSRCSTRSRASIRKEACTAGTATSARSADSRSRRSRSTTSPSTGGPDGSLRGVPVVSRVYVAPISFGLGDLVVSLPAIQALVAQGQRDGAETWLLARSDAQAQVADRIAGLAGSVSEESIDRDH